MRAPTDPGPPGPASPPPRSSVRSGAELAPRPRRRRMAVIGRLGLAVALLAAAGITVVVIGHGEEFGRSDPRAEEIPALEVEPAPVQLGTVAQPAALAPPGAAGPDREQEDGPEPRRSGASGTSDTSSAGGARDGSATMASWATSLARRVDVPSRALQAYGIADLAMRQEEPDCHLSWVTVAGLARVESNHGRYHGSSIDANGRVDPPIVGVPLDGSGGNRTIADTDGGVLDGDPTHDRAVGPLQFIPSTWASWRSDGNGDGVADPNNIDDAALATGRYLCANGRDLATGAGWRAAVLSYNASNEYGRRVFAAADAYAEASQE